MSKKDNLLFYGIYLYDTKEEVEISKLKVIDKNKSIPTLLVLNEPKQGFHKHYFLDRETKKLRAHIKNEKTERRENIDETFQEFRNNKIKEILK